ncbi:MAG: chemotaxis protein CheW [Chitinispirillales bacterium]|jgi:purine-binding chemotaxis protein CheW|nr:chemotaxis protein CheW [Chitinispirillales bacterium]
MPEKKHVNSEKLIGKYLSFVLGNGEYAVDILKIQQVIQIQQITRIPRSPKFIRGVLNLRGKVVPILNLHSKFNMPPVEETEKTCILITEISDRQSVLIVGIIIDEVKDVMDINEEMLTDKPDIGASKSAKHIIGAVRMSDKVRFLLDLNEILVSEEFATLKQAF